jgi:hypothetical protein
MGAEGVGEGNSRDVLSSLSLLSICIASIILVLVVLLLFL